MVNGRFISCLVVACAWMASSTNFLSAAEPKPSTRDDVHDAALDRARRARADFETLFRKEGVAFTIERRPSKSIEATLTQTFTLPNCRVNEWIVFAAMPLDGPGQERVRV